jgi:four helix bundle protein
METNDGDLKERTRSFTLRIISLYAALPKSGVSEVLGRQVLRSGTSVGANYREACRGRSKAEFIAKMGTCLTELDETDYWLDLLASADVVPAQRLQDLRDETNQLTAIFVTIIKRTKDNARSSFRIPNSKLLIHHFHESSPLLRI